MSAKPAITHCDNCGCDWLDNGLNPAACPYCKQLAAVDDTRRLEYLIDNELLVRRLSDTGLWMVTTSDLTPAIDGSEYDTWREAIDAALAAQPEATR